MPRLQHVLDQLDGAVERIVAPTTWPLMTKSITARLRDWAKTARVAPPASSSTASNSYDSDYFGDSVGLSAAVAQRQEFKQGDSRDMPNVPNVFRRDGGTIRRFLGSELLYMPPEPGQEYRHNDTLDPLWNMLDLTPEGRGDFTPS